MRRQDNSSTLSGISPDLMTAFLPNFLPALFLKAIDNIPVGHAMILSGMSSCGGEVEVGVAVPGLAVEFAASGVFSGAAPWC